MSHPMWVRGLKQMNIVILNIIVLSHPMWVRGLKQNIKTQLRKTARRTLCGCVD